jgi:hypothetical protein
MGVDFTAILDHQLTIMTLRHLPTALNHDPGAALSDAIDTL